MLEFLPFPKLARLSRECVVTEKIDGTNAQILIEPIDGPVDINPAWVVATVNGLAIAAGSRTRYLTIGKTSDNYGFAQWVHDNALDLVKLGPGRHFGEWWGKGIQRNYGVEDKRFSLFHTAGIAELPSCVSVAPVLWTGLFDLAVLTYAGPMNMVDEVMLDLWTHGSKAAPGFMNPEGIVVYHTHAKVAFKKTFDDNHKDASIGTR